MSDNLTRDEIIADLRSRGLLWGLDELQEAAEAMGAVLAERRASNIAGAAAIGLLLENIIGQLQPPDLRMRFLADFVDALQRTVRNGLDA